MALNRGAASGDGRGEVSPEKVREQCDRVLSSHSFEQAPTLARLLRYLVDEALAGNADRLKEFAIGLEVFGRGPSFDPRVDTIVRAHARRLRQRLAQYYESDGRHSPVILELPRGHYVIRARPASQADRAAQGPPIFDSIVVLPFASAGGDPSDEYFADGLTEEIINALAVLPGLHVVSRTSAFQFKGRDKDIREIGQSLGVRLALEGSVRREGATVRVAVRLIDVRDGFQIWSLTSDRALTGVFLVQDELSTAIAGQLRVRLGISPAPVPSTAPANADSHDSYLKGRYFWNKGTPESVAKAVKHFREAISLDPAYAAAHAAMADAFVYLATLEAESPGPLLDEARRAAARALELQDVADAHSAMGAVLAIADWAWAGAEREFEQAIRLTPSSSHARGAYALLCLAPQRRIDEAVEQLRQAVRLDPLSTFQRSMLAQVLTLAARYDEALVEAGDALELDPDHVAALLTRAWALIGAGDCGAAVVALQAMPHHVHQLPNHAGHLGHALARAGRRPEAENVLGRLFEGFKEPWMPAVDIAAILCALGERDEALTWLERAHALRSFDVVFAGDDPRFADLWDHPRLQALVTPPPKAARG